MKLSVSILGAALLAASTALYAQAPQGDAAKGERRHQMRDCSKAKDPKACEERQAKMKAAHQKAKSACDAKQGEERRACMQKEMCAQAKDPAQCEARAKDRTASRARIREACKGKEGEALKACVREQRSKK